MLPLSIDSKTSFGRSPPIRAHIKRASKPAKRPRPPTGSLVRPPSEPRLRQAATPRASPRECAREQCREPAKKAEFVDIAAPSRCDGEG